MSIAPAAIQVLVDKFTEHSETYRRAGYNESQLRADFLDPFFIALGWDVYNTKGDHEAYRDVILEQALRVEKSVRAPDYCFRIGGTPKFFVEAKKPAVDITTDVSPAFQLRRYAWTAKLPLSILTDFEELAVYDCRVKPDKLDKPSKARVMFFKYTEFVDRWDELASIFSYDAIRKGSFDKYAESTKKKRGTAEVDDAFLEEIESWREAFAKNISLRNEVSDRELNYAVQMIIDRIIFLRMCEGRNIEPYARLQSLANGAGVYGRLVELFHRADEKYNSGLFHFTKEKGRDEPPDHFTIQLTIDDKVLRDVIRRLYYPESPYEFAALPADILGQVYEQFLGKVIVRSGRIRVRVEEKPEVKKAGGVYYTPTYIVDYIVENTVGKLLEGKTPQEVGGLTPAWKPAKNARPISVLDPACGSGSFLIVAYQFLLDWYLRQYIEVDQPEKHSRGKTPRIYQTHKGDWRLTGAERKRILLSHIYGVDIDFQAVEVTKLSLLLKVLEGETEESLQRQARLFHKERALPDLSNNIKCGNSLIAEDFYQRAQLELFDDEELLRVNAFNWKDAFPNILSRDSPGFDAAIGNPPYVNAWELFENSPQVRDYLNSTSRFTTADAHWDLYVLFLEQAYLLLKECGRMSFIIPFAYAIQKYGRSSRNLFLSRSHILSIADLRSVRVFSNVPVITIIPVIEKAPPPKGAHVRIDRPGPGATPRHAGTITPAHGLEQEKFLSLHEEMLRLDLSDEAFDLCKRIDRLSLKVDEVCAVSYGVQMSSREKGGFGKDHVLRDSKATKSCKPTISGRELYRYSIRWQGRYVEWALANEMYGPRHPLLFERPKLMVRDITGTHRLEIARDNTGLFCDHTVLIAQLATEAKHWSNISEEKVERAKLIELDALQGILASKLVSAYYYLTLTGEGVRTGGGFHTYPSTIRNLPLPNEETLRAKREVLDRISCLAAELTILQQKKLTSRIGSSSQLVRRQIAAHEGEIDQIVYDLYGLNDIEIALVERAICS